VLILGCGNPDRSDDAAGLLVVRRLQALGIDAREYVGEPLELIDAWNGSPEVILIDAVVSGAPPGTITVWDAGHGRLAHDQFCCSTHGFGISDAVELARVLGKLPRRLRVYGIEGVRFEAGGPVSVEVAEAIERLTQKIAGTVRAEPI
jgi:hydrogenase maturation protease